jgi:hypothetical protein
MMPVEPAMRTISAAIAAAACLAAADKGPARGQAANKHARIEAVLHMDKQAVRQVVGEALDEGIVVVELKIAPGPVPLTISRDDFLLRSDKDGQRAQPYSPSEIAGGSVLVVRNTGSGGGITSENRGPIWGGLGGGMPSRMPGNTTGIGNAGGVVSANADVKATGKQKDDPVLAAVEAKVLPEKKIDAEQSGQLYFLMEGKHKVKDIELLYKTPDGRLSVRFKQPN